jgi:hypothetical protein
MRSSLELNKLNKIWEQFNDKIITPEQTQIILLKEKWKHHTQKAKLLLDFTTLPTNK